MRTADTSMSLALITYCLPILLGYLLFVGISGRLDPLARPACLADRPSWALGLWVGATVAGVLIVGLHLAYSTSLGEARTLVAPSAWALSALLLPGLVAWVAYRGAIARALDAEASAHRTSSLLAARIDGFPVSKEETRLESDPETDGGTPLVATFLDVGGPARLDIPNIPVARADVEIALDARGVALLADNLVSAPIVIDAVPRDEHEVALGAAEDLSGLLSLALRGEEARRAETEKHLRITRKALAKLEAESRDHEGDKADALIALEEELESRIRESATAESRATRETARRIEAESAVVALKQDLLSARRDVRRGTAARAKALSAATRSIALTRQAVRARVRLENRMRELEKTLADREATLGSVVRALEKEKGRSQEEIGVLARQLVLHERQLHARRSLEEVARNVEGKLTTRLARKVARARPLVPSS